MSKKCPRCVFETQYEKAGNPLSDFRFYHKQGDQARLEVPRNKSLFSRARCIVGNGEVFTMRGE